MRAPIRHRSPKPLAQGFTYLGVLFAVALLGIGLSVVSEVWVKVAHRQKMAQLDWVGQQYVQAIESYYYANTGSVHFYPNSLEDLLEDKRYLYIRRHLRTLYPDPFTGKVSWALVPSAQGGIQGVGLTLDDGDEHVEKAFVFVPPAP
jgi:type II secretory pathway pseudopilin PulG